MDKPRVWTAHTWAAISVMVGVGGFGAIIRRETRGQDRAKPAVKPSATQNYDALWSSRKFGQYFDDAAAEQNGLRREW
jgi:hypothetical protein